MEDPTERGAAWRLALAVSGVGFGQSALLALVPVASERTGLGGAAMGALAFLGALTFLVAAPLWGGLGAGWRLRRLCALLGGLMVLGHGLFAAALLTKGAAALGLLALSRLVHAAGAAGVVPHAQAALVRRTPEAARPAMLGRLGAGFSLGRIAGSLAMLAGAASPAAPVLLLLASPLVLLAAPDWAAPARAPDAAGRVRPGRGVAPLLAVAFAVSFALGQVQIALGLLVQQRFGLSAGAAAALAGSTLAAVALAAVATQLVLLPRLGPGLGRNLRRGLAALAGGAAVMAASPWPGLLVVGGALAGAGTALATPHYAAWIAARTAGAAQARAAGWLASAHVAGQGAGALAGGAALALAPAAPFWSCAAVALAALALCLGLSEEPTGAGTDAPAGPRPPEERAPAHPAASRPARRSRPTVAAVAAPESRAARPNSAP
ncbi:major facilitator superfamily MFS_1 [Methylobacterium sp. 4-46]|uniref:MFS transporter n=1 Tax=unclassified Methylobacterium TaxID=2615210 RepID=UPI000165CC88|nr:MULTISPECIES: MFS transporter [Methylobacterium]ACA19390.1 major facilitator superfamily MFS_1 [Methylobacterium sp. 4-46]WFT78587.1 MFS transporter [Methylobacterium nodulans]